MAKNYLNKEERETISLGFVMNIRLKEYVEQSAQNMSMEERKNLKTAITMIDKWHIEVFNRVGPQEGEKIKRLFKGSRVIVQSAHISQNTQYDREYMMLDADDIVDMGDAILSTFCCQCTKTVDEMKACNVRICLSSAGVPEYTSSGPCPYLIGVVDNAKDRD